MPKRQFRKEGGYVTDNLIKSLDDRQLLSHMGVPIRTQAFAVQAAGRRMDERVEFWFEHMPYTYRPHHDRQDEKPELFGKGLILYGPGGSGKTVMASAILLRAIRMGIENSDPTGKNFTWFGWCMGAFVDWQDASEMFRRGSGKDEDASWQSLVLAQRMRPAGPMDERGDFLVIDDISRERRTEFNSNELHRILRHRENYGFPTILTTNHPPKEWPEVYDDVLAGFLSRAFVPVEFEQR